MHVHERLFEVAMEKGLRQTTAYSYERLLSQLGVLNMEVGEVTREDVLERLWQMDNPNSRRAAVIAVRSVLGFQIKIPKGVPRRYDLPDEDTLRLALMTSPHEIRGLVMMYAGCRVGEACAVTAESVRGDRLLIDKQVLLIHRTGQKPIMRTGPVKTSEAEVVIPHWLAERLSAVQDTAKPDVVRESLRRAGRRVGVTLNPHMLRHWYATTMLARGVPFSVVSKQMRHSDIAVTLRTYSQANVAGTIHDTFG